MDLQSTASWRREISAETLAVKVASRRRILARDYNREYRDGYSHGAVAWRNAVLPGTAALLDKGREALERILLAHEGKRAPYSKGLSDCLRAALKLD